MRFVIALLCLLVLPATPRAETADNSMPTAQEIAEGLKYATINGVEDPIDLPAPVIKVIPRSEYDTLSQAPYATAFNVATVTPEAQLEGTGHRRSYGRYDFGTKVLTLPDDWRKVGVANLVHEFRHHWESVTGMYHSGDEKDYWKMAALECDAYRVEQYYVEIHTGNTAPRSALSFDIEKVRTSPRMRCQK